MTGFLPPTMFNSSNDFVDYSKRRMGFLATKQGALTPAEEAEYSRLESFSQGLPRSQSSGSLGDLFSGQGGLLDKANAFSERQMQLSNQYRGAEGAWQSQIDEQANRRVVTDGEQKIGLQRVADDGANLRIKTDGGQKIDLQRVMDDGADKRIKTDGDVKLSLQNNQGEVNERAKQNDARRALVNFRSDGKGA